MGIEISGKILSPVGDEEVGLGKARWVKLEELDLEKIVSDEVPVLVRFLKRKSNL